MIIHEDNSTSPVMKESVWDEMSARTDEAFWHILLSTISRLSQAMASEQTVQTRDPRIEQVDIPRYGELTNSTIPLEESTDLDEMIRALLFSETNEVFEAGIESDFSNELVSLIKEYGNDAIMALARLILAKETQPETASEAMRWMGKIHDPQSYHFRLWLLEEGLKHRFPMIRDSAVLGLSHLDDPHAIDYVEKAIEQESRAGLRKDMQKLLVQLKNTQACHSF